jgi:hypothetical protein
MRVNRKKCWRWHALGGLMHGLSSSSVYRRRKSHVTAGKGASWLKIALATDVIRQLALFGRMYNAFAI